ncbi:MAG: response regulator [archaeon]|nr:response regulator [archaeon]
MVKKEEKKSVELDKKEYLIEVVDGHVQTAISVSGFLRRLGYKTIEAYDAEVALKLAKENKPDLILIDTTLNGKGEDLAKQLPNTKVIFMGTDGKLKKNIVGDIKKPIDNSELEILIKKILK